MVEKTGGGTRLLLQAGIYQAFKHAVPKFYSNKNLFPDGLEHQVKEDLGGNCVQDTYKIHGGYTLNLYHTTSKVLVNGEHVTRFLDNHLPAILKSVDEAEKSLGMSARQFNNYFKKATAAYLEQHNHTTQPQRYRTRRSDPDRDLLKYQSENNHCRSLPLTEDSLEQGREVAQMRSTTTTYNKDVMNEDAEDITCSICSSECANASIYCNLCNHWVHYKCEKLNKADITRLETEEAENYNCQSCKGSTMVVTDNPTPLLGPSTLYASVSTIMADLRETVLPMDTVICKENDPNTVEADIPHQNTPHQYDKDSNEDLTRLSNDQSSHVNDTNTTSQTDPCPMLISSNHVDPLIANIELNTNDSNTNNKPIILSTPTYKLKENECPPDVRPKVPISDANTPQLDEKMQQIKAKEKSLATKEKRLKLQEREIQEKSQQTIMLQAIVISLERKMKDLEVENQLRASIANVGDPNVQQREHAQLQPRESPIENASNHQTGPKVNYQCHSADTTRIAQCNCAATLIPLIMQCFEKDGLRGEQD